jgi:acyl carrier protein
MSDTRSDETFFTVLRAYLPYLSADDVLKDEMSLVDYGLDSLGSISLMLDLETALDILFPEDTLTPETFATVGSVRTLVQTLQNAQERPPRS